jgi:hypothetical protein
MSAYASILLDPDRATADDVLAVLERLRANYPPGAATELIVRPPVPAAWREWWGDAYLRLTVRCAA